MHKLYYLLVIIATCPLALKAQSNYRPGYVVLFKNDTVHGFIDYREWDASPKEISFKPSLNSTSRRFTVNDIKLFSVSGQETYKRYTVSISTDAVNIAQLATFRDSSFKVDTVFLKILETGKNVTLYSYTDQLKTRYFLGEQPDFIPLELVYKIYANGGTIVDDSYKKTLFALANKYNVLNSSLIRSIQDADYSSAYILPIVTKINYISQTEFEKKFATKSKAEFFIGAGLNLTNTSTNSSSPYYMAGGRQYTSVEPTVALGVNFIPNAATARLQLRMEIAASENQYSSSFKLSVYPYANVRASFNQFQIYLAPQIIFNFFNAPAFKIYGGFGVAPTYSGYSKAAYISRDPNVSISDIAANDPFFFDSFDIPFLFKAGIDINKKFEIYFNYLTSIPVTKGGYYQLNYAREQIGLYYFFDKN